MLKVASGTGRPQGAVYRGRDRRGLVVVAGRPRGLVGSLLVVVVSLASALAVSAVIGTGPGPVVSGATEVAFVCFLATSGLLLLHWRLVGEAADVPLAAGTAVTGLFVVPTTGHVPLIVTGYPAALRAASVVCALVAYTCADRLPEVRSDLRPGRWLALALALPAVVPSFMVAPSAWWPFPSQASPAVVLTGAANLGCAVLLAVGLARAVRPGRALAAGTLPLVVSLAGSSAALAAATGGGAVSLLAVLFLLTGGISAVVGAGSAVQSAIRQVVLYDSRGRRRWEAAEARLERARRTYQGQRHDINSMLSAMDGTLLVLAGQRDALPASQVDHLVRAVREEVGALRSLLAGPEAPTSLYDLSHLLTAIVSVRSTTGHIKADLPPGLVVEGRPDRLAVVVDNLLANAAAHGGGAGVGIVARQLGPQGDEVVQIRVSDRGPGLGPSEIRRAFERGWRSQRSAAVPGSGLGLYQCRQMVEAEGGSIGIEPTRTGTREGSPGLTAVVTIPVRKVTA